LILKCPINSPSEFSTAKSWLFRAANDFTKRHPDCAAAAAFPAPHERPRGETSEGGEHSASTGFPRCMRQKPSNDMCLCRQERPLTINGAPWHRISGPDGAAIEQNRRIAV
jgi:hypothetical protein